MDDLSRIRRVNGFNGEKTMKKRIIAVTALVVLAEIGRADDVIEFTADGKVSWQSRETLETRPAPRLPTEGPGVCEAGTRAAPQRPQ